MWKVYLTILGFAIITACQTTEITPWRPEIWLCSSKTNGILRAGQNISCEDAKFNEFICLSEKDLSILYNHCLDE